MGHQLKLVLTGDSHHYCRYRGATATTSSAAAAAPSSTRPTICRKSVQLPASPAGRSTARPGQLSARVQDREDGGRQGGAVPGRKTSQRLSGGNLAFAAMNKSFAARALLHLRLLQLDPRFQRRHRARRDARRGARAGTAAGTRSGLYWTVLVPTSPWSALLVPDFGRSPILSSPNSPYSKRRCAGRWGSATPCCRRRR